MVSRSHAPSETPSDLPPPPRAMSHRAPSIAPSTTSSRTLRRHHRGSRSHTGGSTYRPQNEFPNFAQTGDVEIVIAADGQERKYILHRLILSQCSGFFEASTSEEWSQQNGAGLGRIGEDGADDLPIHTGPSRGSNAQRAGDGRIRWRYELDWEHDEDIPMLVRKPLQTPSLFGSSSSHSPQPPPPPPSKPTSFLRNMTHNFSNTTVQTASSYHPQPPANSSTQPVTAADSETLQDYDNLLRTFYNHPPTLHPSNIAEAYIQCKTLLHLADMYDALPIVGPRIDHHLLQFQGRLWKQIAKYPPSYLKLGYLARSKVIFAEALVHVVGSWPSGRGQLVRGGVAPQVLEVVEDKVDELAERRMLVEARLFRITLLTSKGDRVTPQNAYIDWLALSLFRSWLSDNIGGVPTIITSSSSAAAGPGSNHQAPSSAANSSSSTLYRKMGQAGSAYLTHDECKKFLRLSRPEDHGRETLKRFERKLDEIKAIAKEAVRPLMKHNLELDAGGGGLGYLTCTKVEEEDYPWD